MKTHDIVYDKEKNLYQAILGEIIVCEGTHEECQAALENEGYYPY